MYMGYDFMNEIRIIDVDENGNAIENIDWSLWQRIKTEEVFDEQGALKEILSHCEPIPQQEINARAATEAQEKLKATDYIASKFGDALMDCHDTSDILLVVEEFNSTYGDVLKQRQIWREEINNATAQKEV